MEFISNAQKQDFKKIVEALGTIEHESPSMTAKYNKVENGRRYYLERLDKTSVKLNII